MNPQLVSIGHATYDAFLMIDEAEVYCDIRTDETKVCFQFGSKIPVEHIEYSIGGGAANVSAGAKKLGLESILYSKVGNDKFGDFIRTSLQNTGVDVSQVVSDEHDTDQATILSYLAQRTVFTHGQKRIFKLSECNIPDTSALFVSSLGKEVSSLYRELARWKGEHPSNLFFYNPGSRELKYTLDDVHGLMPYIDYFIANVEEGCAALNTGLTRAEIEIPDLMSLLAQKGVSNIILTDAEHGVHAQSGETGYMHLDAFPAHVIEMTGAGDAFASGFIAATLYGKDFVTALHWGLTNGASVIEHIGAQEGLLSQSEVEKRLLLNTPKDSTK